MTLLTDSCQPFPQRDGDRLRLGLRPGTKLELSRYGAGLQLLRAGRTTRLVEVDGTLVAESGTGATDDVVFSLVDTARR